MRLELRSVTAGYGGTTAIRDVDLVVPSGKTVALLGPNGAGKTTTLSVASGLVMPRSGSLVVDGEDVTGISPEALVRLGMCHITEGRSIFPGLSVRENLRMFAPLSGRATEATERAIEAFPILGERLNQVAGTMSGGQQQMLALARAYARQAPLVLLDEVSLGLAPLVVDEIFTFLRKLVAEGSGLLLVEQYASKALALADIVYLMARGRVVFVGEPTELIGSDLFARYLGGEAAVA